MEAVIRRNLRVILEYDGTHYLGWQVQPQGPTIQSEIESALHTLTGEHIRITGSGRTDAGVHALGQVANFRVESRIPVERFAGALNARLPLDIVVRKLDEVPADFHARFDACAKHYRYTIINRRMRPVRDRLHAHHVTGRLDHEAMQRAACHLVGRKDFRSFATVDPLRANRSAVRHLFEASVRREGDRVYLDFVASGFLYNMARCMAGTLLDVGLGKTDEREVSLILAARDRRLAGPNLTARGLTLMEVFYEKWSGDLKHGTKDPIGASDT
jgi:tRNA pseudouridine38-40 synthase